MWLALPHLLTEENIRRLRATLSSDEEEKAQRFRFVGDRVRFIVRRGLLRILIGEYTQLNPRGGVRFCLGPHGKPGLADGSQRSVIQFNVSHSDELILLAFSLDREIGVDVERVRSIPEALQIAEWFFSPREAEVLRTLPPDQVDHAFAIYWTRTEAYLKARGIGLVDLQNSFDPTPFRRGLTAPDEEAGVEGPYPWSVYTWVPLPGYVATLVAEGSDWELVYRWWVDVLPENWLLHSFRAG